MTARMYQVVDGAKVPALKGQAKIVMDALVELKDAPRLGVDVDKVAAPNLKTRQDTLRVTLYYIIIFKNKGWVRASEQGATIVEEPTVEELEATVSAS